MLARHAWIPFLLMAAHLAAQQGHLVTETEPNDSKATANVIQLGDTISGTTTFVGERDIDVFAYDLTAGAKLEITVPQRQFCHAIAIYDAQDHVLRSQDCFTDRGPNDSMYVKIPSTGRYYVRIVHTEGTPGDEGHTYTYKLRVALYVAPPTGPANPMHLFSSDVAQVFAMVAALNGDLLVVDRSIDQAGHEQFRLLRLTPDGHPTTVATGFSPTGQITVDAFGDLLVPAGEGVLRFNLTTGARTLFTGPSTGEFAYTGIAIGADGDVWVSQPGASLGATISRFNALGVFKTTMRIPVGRTFALTTSQSGELFFMTQDSGDVYKLVNNTTPQRVITAPGNYPIAYGNRAPGVGSVALDQDGWVYLTQPRQGKLLAFNAQYQLIRDPLAQVLDSLHWVEKQLTEAGPVWMRDANGNMTSRLLVAREPGFYDEAQGPSEILETNHAGMGAPGADPGLHVDLAPLRAAALTVTYNDTLRMVGGGTATWSVVDGHLPAGLVLSANGVLTGIPTTKGTSEFAVRGVNGTRAGFARMKIVVNETSPVQVTEDDIASALMGGASLSADVVTYLDTHGNNNGRLDVGDLRAYLRAQGQLSGSKKP